MVKVAFVVGHYPPVERQRRIDTALSYATPEIEIGIVPVDATPEAVTPAGIAAVGPAFLEAYRTAEREGYDAIVPLGCLDLAVDGGRSAVDIPIIAPAEAMLHLACLVGDRFGALVYHHSVQAMMKAIVRRYGMEHKIAGWRTAGFDRREFTANRDAMIRNFVANARELIEQNDCDVILPLGISQCPVHIKPDWLSKELGVPVIEGIGAPIHLAAMFARLGIKHSRRRWYRFS